MLAHNHYEKAFEAWLREWRVPYIAVSEQRRSLFGDSSLKSMDFVISLPGAGLLVDIKGRQSNRTSQRSSAENWITRDDLDSLNQWQTHFGANFRPLLVFAYRQRQPHLRLSCSQILLGDDHYGFYGVELDRYMSAVKTRSARWDTLALSRDEFRSIRQPIASFLPRELFLATTTQSQARPPAPAAHTGI